MLSQYSWWDFAKFILILAVPYYAFVLWKYYREDIREMITNRGKAPAPIAEATGDDDDDEQELSNLYTATNYATAHSLPEPVPAVNNPSTSAQPTLSRTTPDVKKEAELSDGHVLSDEPVSSFTMPLTMEVIRPQEEPLDEVVAVAKTLVVDQEGAVSAKNIDDEKARRLAAAINQQQGNAVFGGIPFNR